MMIGRRGAAIGEIGITARKDLQVILDKTVHLIVRVKVAKKP